MNEQSNVEFEPDYSAIKAKQKVAWATGDYSQVGQTLQIVGENLADACGIRASQKVLDVAAGHGNFSLAAARRWADVTSTLENIQHLGRNTKKHYGGVEVVTQKNVTDTLKTGIKIQKCGKVREAARLYRSVLKADSGTFSRSGVPMSSARKPSTMLDASRRVIARENS